MDVIEKECRICKNFKLKTEFSLRKSSRDGYNNICKSCDNNLSKDRYNKKKNEKKPEIIIIEKECTICKKNKPTTEFRKRIYSTLGFYSECKSCETNKNKIRNDKIIKKRVEVLEKKCEQCNETKLTTQFHKHSNSKDGFLKLCIDCNNTYRKENIKIITEKKCSKCTKIKKPEAFNKSISKNDGHNTICKQCNKQYCQDNKKAINEQINMRYKNDITYNLYRRMRSRLYKYITSNKINKNKNKSLDSIGLEPILFNNWIEWNKEIDELYDNIHLDHLIPLDSFKNKNWDDIIKTKCNHWTNIRPILSTDNLSKSNKMPNKNELFQMELRVYIFKKINNIK